LSIDLNGLIENISSTCINVLGLDLRKIAKEETNITHAIPDFFERNSAYEAKNGAYCTAYDYTKKNKQFMANVTV
jgi:hypothetical protein